MMKKEIEFIGNYTKEFFAPQQCNQVPVIGKNGRYDLKRGSYVIIPAGTKVEIYENIDDEDPRSDTFIVSVILEDNVDTILAGNCTARKLKNG